MRVKHLKDKAMQDYAKGILDVAGREAEGHIKLCADCSRAVDDYRVILVAVKADDIPDLQEGFSDRVVVRLNEQLALQPVEEQWFGLNVETVFSLILGGVLGILLTFYYSGSEAFNKFYEILSLQAIQVSQGIVKTVSGLLTKSGLKPELLLFVCLLLLLFAILDKQLTRAKRSRLKLDSL